MTTATPDLMTDIPATITGFWEETSAPVLLSALGGRLSPESRAELRVTKRTLRDYIEEHLGDAVRIVEIPQKGTAAVPAAGTAGLTDDTLVRAHAAFMRDKARSRYPRFYPEVWAAFSRPLEGKRFLVFAQGSRPRLMDLAAQESPPEHGIEVEEADLPGIQLGLGAEPGPVAEAIKRWATRHEIDLAIVYVPTQPSSPRSAGRSAAASQHQGLAELLSLFEPHELARINIPADVLLGVLQRAAARK